jgi:F-type H+-transporting ATPase subunit b
MTSFRKLFAVLPAAGAALYALPLMAAESGEKSGLPQLDTTLFPEQLFWLAISFAILYVMMAYVALPGVKRTQGTRRQTIAAELAAASAANEAAKAMIAQYEKALADARASAQATVGEITAQAAKESTSKQAKQQQDLHQRLHEAEAKIIAARNAALKEVNAAATELSNAIVEKLTGAKVKA